MHSLVPAFVVFFGLLLVLTVLAAAVKARGEGPAIREAAYVVQKSVLTPAERSFVGVLEPVLPEGVGLLIKIRLADVFEIRPGLTRAARTAAFNRISAKHVDFLLVRASDVAPVIGIELDDSSHAAERRKSRDSFVDEVFRSCRVPLLRIPAKAAYNAAELRADLEAVLAKSKAPA